MNKESHHVWVPLKALRAAVSLEAGPGNEIQIKFGCAVLRGKQAIRQRGGNCRTRGAHWDGAEDRRCGQ